MSKTKNEKKPANYDAIAIILVLVFFPAGLPIMWAKTAWNKFIKIAITAFFAIVFAAVAIDSISDIATMSVAIVMAAYCASVPFWARQKKQNVPEIHTQNDTQHAQATYFENGIKVYLNTKTNVCHFSPDCPAYKNANPENKQEFLAHSANDLVNYEFCSRCAED